MPHRRAAKNAKQFLRSVAAIQKARDQPHQAIKRIGVPVQESHGLASLWIATPFNAKPEAYIFQEGIRAVVGEMLEGRGFGVVVSRSGPTALKLLQEFPGSIELLLTDIHMPRMAGPELARRARLLRPEMKVLYMSASGAEVLSSEQIEPDPQILAKPFSSEVLDQRVRRALSQ